MSDAATTNLPDWRLRHDPWGRVVLTKSDGTEFVGVEPVRAFPITAPQQGISLLDREGKEILWIEDLPQLPAELRTFLEDELTRRTFVPQLRRVLAISSPVEPSEWHVETDRGQTRFLLKNEDDVHRLDSKRALVTDAHGIRYLIHALQELDATSRRLLERFL